MLFIILFLADPHAGFDTHSGVGGACGEYVTLLDSGHMMNRVLLAEFVSILVEVARYYSLVLWRPRRTSRYGTLPFFSLYLSV